MSVFKRKRTVKLESGKTVTRQSSKWHVRYRDVDGIVRTVPAYKDKEASRQLESRLMKEAALAKEGVVDRYREYRKRPVREHLQEFRASLIAKGNTTKHADLVYSRALTILDGCKFVFMGDINGAVVQSFLADLRRQGLGIQSSNHYLRAIKQFTRWLAADGRTDSNPLAYLSGQNPKTDVRHARRALEDDEIVRLMDATERGEFHSAMKAYDRAMLYRLALTTGLRASELKSLTWRSFDLNDTAATVKVLAGYSKHRRDDVLPLRQDVAQLVRRWPRQMMRSSRDSVPTKRPR